MDPCAVNNMLYCEKLEELQDIYGPLNLDKAELVLLPINDNHDPLKTSKNLIFCLIIAWCIVGGSHWALLVYFRDVVFYVDSGSGAVILNTHSIAMKMKSLVNKQEIE